MLILGIDSASDGCGVCLIQDGHVLAHSEKVMARGQDQHLMPLILALLQDAKVSFEQLNRIAVIRGPGSFTGIRISLAAARGMGLSLNIPIIGIDRFKIFKKQFEHEKNDLLVVLQSKRKELFCKFYEAKTIVDIMPPLRGQEFLISGRKLSSESSMFTLEEIKKFAAQYPHVTVTGDVKIDDCATWRPAREHEIITASKIAHNVKAEDQENEPTPLYIREPDVTFAKAEISDVITDQAPLLADIHRESFGEAAWSLQQIKNSINLPTTKGWAIARNRQIVGFILCQATDVETEILTLCVHPTFQRQGLAAQILVHAMTESHGRIFLDVAADNHAALKLYQKAGFIKDGIRKNYYQRKDSSVDAVLFSRPAG